MKAWGRGAVCWLLCVFGLLACRDPVAEQEALVQQRIRPLRLVSVEHGHMLAPGPQIRVLLTREGRVHVDSIGFAAGITNRVEQREALWSESPASVAEMDSMEDAVEGLRPTMERAAQRSRRFAPSQNRDVARADIYLDEEVNWSTVRNILRALMLTDLRVWGFAVQHRGRLAFYEQQQRLTPRSGQMLENNNPSAPLRAWMGDYREVRLGRSAADTQSFVLEVPAAGAPSARMPVLERRFGEAVQQQRQNLQVSSPHILLMVDSVNQWWVVMAALSGSYRSFPMQTFL